MKTIQKTHRCRRRADRPSPAPPSAQVVGKMEDQIRWRQSAYTTMGWSMARIKANVEGSYNKDQVIEAANVIQAIANSKLGALYQPGTDKGKGWEDTRLKPEFFTDKETLGKVAGAFNKAANDMAKVAASGDATGGNGRFRCPRQVMQGLSRQFQTEVISDRLTMNGHLRVAICFRDARKVGAGGTARLPGRRSGGRWGGWRGWQQGAGGYPDDSAAISTARRETPCTPPPLADWQGLPSVQPVSIGRTRFCFFTRA